MRRSRCLEPQQAYRVVLATRPHPKPPPSEPLRGAREKEALGDPHLPGLYNGENPMKSIASIIALAIAIAFTAPAFAGPGSTITNKEDCEKAGKIWDEAGKKCVEKQ